MKNINKSANDALDEIVLAVIRSGKTPIRNKHIVECCENDKRLLAIVDMMRAVDRSIQRLRKAGKIEKITGVGSGWIAKKGAKS